MLMEESTSALESSSHDSPLVTRQDQLPIQCCPPLLLTSSTPRTEKHSDKGKRVVSETVCKRREVWFVYCI